MYVYRCECGHEEQLLRSMEKRDQPVRCPKCARQMERKLAAPAVPRDGTYSYRSR